jgi:hypothetical protein
MQVSTAVSIKDSYPLDTSATLVPAIKTPYSNLYSYFGRLIPIYDVCLEFLEAYTVSSSGALNIVGESNGC